MDYFNFDNSVKIRVDNNLYSPIARDYVKEIVFALNYGSFDRKIDLKRNYDSSNSVLDYLTILSIYDDSVFSVSSYLVFVDGSSSDIRVSRL